MTAVRVAVPARLDSFRPAQLPVEAPPGLKPYPYQREAIDAARAAWDRGVAAPAEVLPTGSGKTVVMAHLANEWLEETGHGQRALLLAHRDELLTQAARKFRSASPLTSVGTVDGRSNQAGARIVCGSVQTLGGRDSSRLQMIRDIGLLMIDEAHHATAPTYRRVIDYCVQRGAKLLGMTATMVRSDREALGDVWDEVVYSQSIAYMISNGYLVRPRAVRVRVEDLDLASVKRAQGDYQAGQLGEALEHSLAPSAIAKAISEQASTKQGIIFAPTVHSAEVIASAVRAAGFTVGVVHGKLATDERRRILEDFEAGRLQWIANCMVLTEGTDLPCAEVCVIARPTSSVGLYVQMVGRVLRLYPGKTEALILDVVGATRKHRLASPIDLFGDDRANQVTGLAEAGIELEDMGLDEDEREEVTRERAEPEGVDGRLVFELVDMFRSSAMDWHRTDGGVWFIAAGERLIALVPGIVAHTWDVVGMHKSRPGTGRTLATAIEDQGYARARAEQFVQPEERTTAARDRSWRKAGATEAAKAYARRLGLYVDEGAKASEISGLIDQRLGTNRIDPHVPWYARGR